MGRRKPLHQHCDMAAAGSPNRMTDAVHAEDHLNLAAQDMLWDEKREEEQRRRGSWLGKGLWHFLLTVRSCSHFNRLLHRRWQWGTVLPSRSPTVCDGNIKPHSPMSTAMCLLHSQGWALALLLSSSQLERSPNWFYANGSRYVMHVCLHTGTVPYQTIDIVLSCK